MNSIKKYLFVAIAAMLFCFVAAANPVSQSAAARMAQQFMSQYGLDVELTDVTAQTPFTHFYIFTSEMTQEGRGCFVLVSGDNAAMPIIGYSTTSAFDAKNMPDNVREQLELYESELAISGQWPAISSLSSAIVTPPAPLTAVAPLITTQWSQNPYYNNLCPYHTASGERSVTGCVATATAQVMKKWNHPATGYGSHTYSSTNTVDGVTYTFPNLSANFGSTTYQWSSMPNALTSVSSSTQVSAVATLMYHIGVAVEMAYSPVSSGAHDCNFEYMVPSSESALQLYFKYRSDMASVSREDYTDAEWLALLKDDLDAGRPIIFSGRDPEGGHSFVCDGYNNSNLFHINWGWGGAYDGYFAMGALNPDGGGTGSNTGTYNLSNVALTRIQPNLDWSATGSTTVTATATGGTGCSVTGAGSYDFGDTIELYAQAATGYHFVQWSDGHKFNPRHCIANGGSLSFTAQFAALDNDTVTYCPGNRHLTSWGSIDNTTVWGIRIPSSAAALDSALMQVEFYASELGAHSIMVLSGGDNPTVNLYTNTFTVSDYGWQTVSIGGVIAPSGNDVWILLSSNADYPAAVTYGCGHPYGRVWGSNLASLDQPQHSFMLRAIFGDTVGYQPTPPVPPADECIIDSFPYIETFDDASTYSCLRLNNANGDTVTWGLIDSFGVAYSRCAFIMYAVEADDYLILPAIVTPGNYTVSWKAKAYNSGYPESYQVIAGDTTIFSETISNTTFLTRTATFSVAEGDTVNLMFRYISDDMYAFFIDNITIDQVVGPNPPDPPVVSCQVTSFPYTMGFGTDEMDDFVNCWTLVDADGDGNGWTTEVFNGAVGSASYINNIGVLTPDNWLISPQMVLPDSSGYLLSWLVGAPDSNYFAEHYGVFVSTTGTATTDFTLLQQYTMTTHNETAMSLDLSAYAGQSVYIAFRHWNITDVFWMYLDDITVTQTEMPVPPAPQQYTVNVTASNAAWGSVSGGGTYTEGSTVTITATANNGYHFVQWNDGNTANPRTITVTADMTYTAVFEADPQPQQYTVSVAANNNAWGSVSGGGTYTDGSTVTITATAYSGYHFVRWNDGNTANPRTITVTANVTYTAFFEADQQQGIDEVQNSEFEIYPNPASTSVTLALEGFEGVVYVDVVDMNGCVIANHEIRSSSFVIDVADMAPGTYFLRVTSGTQTAVRKLVVK